MVLTDSIKQSIHEIDALLEGSRLGTLIVEDGQAYWELSNGGTLQLNDSFQIEAITDCGNHFITYQEATNTLSTD